MGTAQHGARMKIIAFDLGRNFAWAYNGSNVILTGNVNFGTVSRAHRQGLLLTYLKRLFIQIPYGVEAVIYETPFARGRDATRSLWGIAGIIEATATNAGLPVVDAAVPTIKKFATGHGKACKEDMIAAAHKFGYKGDNEHEADSVCLLRYAEANLERVLK